MNTAASILSTVVNSVPVQHIENLKTRLSHTDDFPVYLIPTEPSLEKPTVGNIAEAVNARIFSGDGNALSREVYQYKVAAMLVPDFLDYLEDGDLIITPGDRAILFWPV